MSSAERFRGRGGFTLVEVLVALVLAVLLGGVIFQVVQGESRFATVQSAREEVQQNSRGALEILASELRAAQPAGLVSADTNSISFLLPRIWGISCGGGNGASLPVIFPAAGGTVFDLNTASGLMADTGTVATPAWGPSPNPTASARARDIALAAQNPALGVAGNACADVRSSSGGALLAAYNVTGTNIPRAPAGNVVYLYQLVTYTVALDGNEYWIYRTLGSGSAQPLAGPVDGANGLALTYYDAAGARITPQPITALATLKTVARVGITVKAKSRTQGNANLTDTQATSITLRN